MLYAKVVLGLPVEGPFDYSVPAHLHKRIKEGVRVWIQFRDRRKLGYVLKLTSESSIEHVKPILEIIDDSPVLDKNMLLLTMELSDYYGCSWGEAIETALPEGLRKGKKIANNIEERKALKHKYNKEAILIHDLNRGARWDIYLKSIKETLDNNKSALILLPDIASVLKVKEIITANLGISPALLYRKQHRELEEWVKIKKGGADIVIGTRSAIFAPVSCLGLVIIDEEQNTVYKQDQVPHYHAREVAFMRIAIEKAKLILGSTSPSLESFYLAKRGKIKYTLLPRIRDYPQIKIIDMRQEQRYLKQGNIILSKYLQDSIIQAIDAKSKILLFLNRRGFATFASCRNCGVILKCPRCNINLVYHFKENELNCRYCNFKMDAPRICPNCNSAYIRYLGVGTEKIESELSRIFPQAKISRVDSPQDADLMSADIFISTASIIKRTDYNFGLIGILSIDNSLNRIDLRSTEKTFGLLVGLLALTDKKVVIQTGLPKHYSLQAIENKDINMFYDEELRQRKQLSFPPYRHLCLVKLRGKKENSVKEASIVLFEKLGKYAETNKLVKVISVNPGQPGKLRGNFYWQILIKSGSPLKIVKFLKLHLKNFRHSGIIVTIDVDPL
ncbi:MAG: primosomal protein N' [Candidatus Omnitrophota bacterium]|nr:primosomal protein N' [Candidatus Omnitrophota bacterium]